MLVHSVEARPGSRESLPGWPFDVPAVAQLLRDGIRFGASVMMLVGENGSGKSTIVEAIAEAYGLDARGGRAGRRYVNDRPQTPLSEHLRLRLTPAALRQAGRRRQGYFLRAETAHGFFEFVTGMPGYWQDDVMSMSHGEGFLTVLDTMFRDQGLYLMDEPESALSFASCLRLVAIIQRLADTGSQVICATHSPVLAAAPGAQILQLDESGMHPVDWSDLELVDHWRRFLAGPDAYLRHLAFGDRSTADDTTSVRGRDG